MTHKGKPLKVAVLASKNSEGMIGGAERLYKGLLEGLNEIGCFAEIIEIQEEKSSFEAIKSNYERCYQLDLSAFDVVISTKAPTYAVSHRHHVMYLVHTVRAFDDMFSDTFPHEWQENFIHRAELHRMDFTAMSKIKAKFAIGHEVANRLYRWRGLNAQILHPPLTIGGWRCERVGDYFFLPGRLHPWKRVDLVIDAVKKSTLPLRLIISGTGEVESELKLRAGKDSRIEFIGMVNDKELIELFSNALAVPFVPIREDYGYVTLEAFASGKAVVTCSDSGEPTYFVKNGDTGLVCDPHPESIRYALEWLFNHREDALQMGQRGKELTKDMSWPKVATRLVEAALNFVEKKQNTRTKVAVLDMQPIVPPVGGGRQRLLGLYHNLGEELECQYIGTYDWPGESYRKHQLTSGLEEIDIPLSDEHHAAARSLSNQAGGKTVIDIAFSRLGHLSPAYIDAARKATREADVVVFSHPWIYPLVAEELSLRQIVVYDSQNVEGYLRAQLLDEQNPVEAELLQQVVIDEYRLCRRADLIFTCSHEDLMMFHRIYEISPDKMRIIPNGVMVFAYSAPDLVDKSNAKRKLKLTRNQMVAIFIGSAYGPNVEAGKFIVDHLSDALPMITFVIAGGVGARLSSDKKNVIITGFLDENKKQLWLKAADIAVNPMFSGSGTNIKMFDFMAMRLPTITTSLGARGIKTGSRKTMLIVDPKPEAFASAINTLQDELLRNRIGNDARLCAEEGYAWERISQMTGKLFQVRHFFIGQPKPFFSVVVPSYERHQHLDALIGCLQKQIERDFEVVIVDQSAERWQGADESYGFPLVYYHSPVRGVSRARNTGAMLAQGRVIAFTDDDCFPVAHWLINAREYFRNKKIVGVEGMVVSDHLGDPKWRQVTNVGFEGIGFMTANLMVRSGIFQYLGGFDLEFDVPFREDTDFGWRLQKCGLVPYAKDVVVFHPAQSRAVERESASTRARFFQKDALLYKKHPERYRELFYKERHFINMPGFGENLIQGFKDNNMIIPEWIKRCLDQKTHN